MIPKTTVLFGQSKKIFTHLQPRRRFSLSCVQSVPFIVSLNTAAVTGNAGKFKIFMRLICHGRWLDKRDTLPALFYCASYRYRILFFNPLKAKLNPICHLLALLGAHHIVHVSRIRIKEANYHLSNASLLYRTLPAATCFGSHKHNIRRYKTVERGNVHHENTIIRKISAFNTWRKIKIIWFVNAVVSL